MEPGARRRIPRTAHLASRARFTRIPRSAHENRRTYNGYMENTDQTPRARKRPGGENGDAWQPEKALATPPAEGDIREASELLKVLGDLTRMRLLCALLREGELSVGGLQDALGMSQSAVSHQLKVLRDARLVGFERSGKTVRYSLADDHVRDLLRVVLEHARHD